MEQINIPTANASNPSKLLESMTREELLTLSAQFSELIFLLRENNALLRNYAGLPHQEAKFPHFDVPASGEYDGSTHPYPHIKFYAERFGDFPNLDRFKVLSFQKSLSGKALEWFSQMDHSKITSWADLTFAFIKFYEASKVAGNEPKTASRKKRPRYEEQWDNLTQQPSCSNKPEPSRKGKGKMVELSPNITSGLAREYIPVYPRYIDFARPFPFSLPQPYYTQTLPITPQVHLSRTVEQSEENVSNKRTNIPRTLNLLKKFDKDKKNP